MGSYRDKSFRLCNDDNSFKDDYGESYKGGEGESFVGDGEMPENERCRTFPVIEVKKEYGMKVAYSQEELPFPGHGLYIIILRDFQRNGIKVLYTEEREIWRDALKELYKLDTSGRDVYGFRISKRASIKVYIT